jgi:hypothetical protein
MDNAAAWSALQSDGVTASTEISMVNDVDRFRYGVDRKSAKIVASSTAVDHSLRRTIGPLDLTALDELRLWAFADRMADERASFYLDVRMASAAIPFTDPANTWQRYVPVPAANSWNLARIKLAGLPAAIRGAVNQLQLRCVDATNSFTIWLDDLIAVRDDFFADIEQAFVDRLHNKVLVGGQPVPALVHTPDVAVSPPDTWIRVMLFDVRYSDERTSHERPRGDYSAAGYNVRPRAVAYDLIYQFDVFGEDRAAQTTLLTFILRELGVYNSILVNGVQIPIEPVIVPATEMLNGVRTDRVGFKWKVQVRQEAGAVEPVTGVSAVLLETDFKP